ncbi:MAG: HNH endonuclease [Rhodobacteraceae bacterium]|nr:HNH endonuclease [Paracoccaceae bacterium]
MRADFTPAIRHALAERAGHRCSFPGCDLPTSGPSDESNTASSRSGTACHIIAASTGRSARRVVSNTPHEKLVSIENGIWMCRNHGKLIDDDETRFTIELLRQWRQYSEQRARLAQRGKSIDNQSLGLFSHKIKIHGGDAKYIHTEVGCGFADSGVETFWGRDNARLVRDFFIEVSLNALTHGKASEVSIEFCPREILYCDNGGIFDPRKLRASTLRSGATVAVKHLFEKLGNRSVLSVEESDDGHNQISFALLRTLEDLESHSPCILRAPQNISKNSKRASSFFGCETVFVEVPDYSAFSMAFRIEKHIKEQLLNKKIVFVKNDVSNAVMQELLQTFPNAEVLEI